MIASSFAEFRDNKFVALKKTRIKYQINFGGVLWIVSSLFMHYILNAVQKIGHNNERKYDKKMPMG